MFRATNPRVRVGGGHPGGGEPGTGEMPANKRLGGKGLSKGRDRWGAGGDPPGASVAPRLIRCLPTLTRSRRAVVGVTQASDFLGAIGGAGSPLGRPTKARYRGKVRWAGERPTVLVPGRGVTDYSEFGSSGSDSGGFALRRSRMIFCISSLTIIEENLLFCRSGGS